MGSIRGTVGDYAYGGGAQVPIGILRITENIEPVGPQPDYTYTVPNQGAEVGPVQVERKPGVHYSDTRGEFEIPNLAAGLYVVSPAIGWAPAQQAALWVTSDGVSNAGSFKYRPDYPSAADPVGVFTVCEALERPALSGAPIVVVGVFKSGVQESLRLDCPFELTSGDAGWPSAIGLSNVVQPPESLRGEVEKKRQEILQSAPPEGPLRPERVIGLAGRFVSLECLKIAPCCTARFETSFPSARLFGLDEKDMRVIR